MYDEVCSLFYTSLISIFNICSFLPVVAKSDSTYKLLLTAIIVITKVTQRKKERNKLLRIILDLNLLAQLAIFLPGQVVIKRLQYK